MRFHPSNTDLSRFSFLVTGGAGFIGSHLVEYLLSQNAGKVKVIDNLSTGFLKNLEFTKNYSNFEFIEADICDQNVLKNTLRGVNYVLHQAALGSVPRSVENPIATNNSNITGFLNVLWAAKEEKVKRMIYASSSSVFGDSTIHPKVEDNIGMPLSPYAVTKRVNELYANVFNKIYGLEIIGLRYFNIFGPRQHPKGPYAAAIPLFIQSLLRGEKPKVFGNGTQTRDFTFVENAVQANIKALFTQNENSFGDVFNIAFGKEISLLDLIDQLNNILGTKIQPEFLGERKGDVKFSLASTKKAFDAFNYEPNVNLTEGLKRAVDWYKHQNF